MSQSTKVNFRSCSLILRLKLNLVLVRCAATEAMFLGVMDIPFWVWQLAEETLTCLHVPNKTLSAGEFRRVWLFV